MYGDFQVCISVPLSRSAIGEATRIYKFITNNHVLFNLSEKEHVLNHQNVSKNYENDCKLSVILVSNKLCLFKGRSFEKPF